MNQASDLIRSIQSNDLPAFERLLHADRELVRAQDERGNSALLLSVYHHKPELTARLLELGAPTNFFEACAVGLAERAREQLMLEPALAQAYSHDGWTGLHLAAFFGHRPLVLLLLEGGSDPLAVSRNHEANLAINAAAASGRDEIVRLLVERGCPVDARGGDGAYTALHLAAHAGNSELVRWLLEAGASRTLKTAAGETARDLAAKHEAALAVLSAPL